MIEHESTAALAPSPTEPGSTPGAFDRDLFTRLNLSIADLWAGAVAGEFWRHVVAKGFDRELYRLALIQIFHYTRRNSINQAVAALRGSTEEPALLRFVYSHAREELGHERLVVKDLKSIGRTGRVTATLSLVKRSLAFATLLIATLAASPRARADEAIVTAPPPAPTTAPTTASTMAPSGTAPAPPPPSAAPVRERTFWIAGGIGPAQIGSDSAAQLRAEATFGLGLQTFSLRYTFTEELCHGNGGFFCDNAVLPWEDNKEIALLYGVKVRAPFFVALASIGPAALWTTQRGSTLLSQSDGFWFGSSSQYNSIKKFTVGGAIEAGVYLSSRFVSIGPTVAIDFDWFQSSMAVLIDLHVGYMGEPGARGAAGNVDKPWNRRR